MKAKALYDNPSDDAEELSFLKNDLMEVLEQDYDGMEGWWLCRLKGKTGIAPGNRLMIVTVGVIIFIDRKLLIHEMQHHINNFF